MAHFPSDYFQGETRDGFYIEPMMKCAWAAMIEVLEVVDEICAKHGIRYFAHYGTLLGAVRHQGFIPWDDDMDIAMFRDDYMRFLEIAPEELPEGWHIHSIYDTLSHPQLHALVTNTDKIDYSQAHLKRFHGCPYSTGLDLYPLDSLAPSQEEDRNICELLKILVYTAQLCDEYPAQVKELLPEIENLCHVTVNADHTVKNQLMRLADKVSQTYNAAGVVDVSDYAGHAKLNQRLRLKADCYRKQIVLPFETVSIPAPVGYDAILKQLYGDYMTPVQGARHEYPFWKKQEEILAECFINSNI